MSYDDSSEINGTKLAEQWGVPTETVSSMVAGAKRISPNGNLFKELAGIGFTSDDLPEWFGEGYRQSKQGDDDEVEDDEDDETPDGGGKSGKTGTIDAVLPKETSSKGQGGSGVKSTQRTTSQRTTAPYIEDTSDASISPEDSSLLASRGITYDGANGVWVKVQRQGKGQYVEQRARIT